MVSLASSAALPYTWKVCHGPNHWSAFGASTQPDLEKIFRSPSGKGSVDVSLFGGPTSTMKVNVDDMTLDSTFRITRVSKTKPAGSVAFWNDSEWQRYQPEDEDLVLSALAAGRSSVTCYTHGMSINVKMREKLQTGTYKSRPLQIDHLPTIKFPTPLDWSSAAADVPNNYLCPITHQPMTEPVVAMDGYTYERLAIEKWFAKKVSSPKVGEPLDSARIVVNWTLRAEMAEWLMAQHPPSSSGASKKHKLARPSAGASKKKKLVPLCTFCNDDASKGAVACDNGCDQYAHIRCFIAQCDPTAPDDTPFLCTECLD